MAKLKLPKTKGDLRYPNMREELISYLAELADPDLQKCWLSELAAADGIPASQFDYAVHFLFDDTDLASDPEGCIGWYLYDKGEAVVVSKVTDALDVLFEVHGTNLPDGEYINAPEWPRVMEAAAKALDYFQRNRGV